MMRVNVQAGQEIRISGVIGIIPEQDTAILIKVPFFLKGSSQVADLLKAIVNAGGTVEILRE